MNASQPSQSKPFKVNAVLRSGHQVVDKFLTVAEAYAAGDKYEAGGHEATMPPQSSACGCVP